MHIARRTLHGAKAAGADVRNERRIPRRCPRRRRVPSPAHICAGTGLTPATSAPGLGSPRPHLRQVCAGTWPTPAHIRTGDRAHSLPTSSLGLGSPLLCTSAPGLPGLTPAHFCAGTHWARPSHICAGTVQVRQPRAVHALRRARSDLPAARRPRSTGAVSGEKGHLAAGRRL